jgi:2-hydroxychromene-2-carboxylate isomerase
MNPKTPVRVYIDFKSPYSYVAVRPLIEFSRAEGIGLEWLPYTLKLKRSEGAGDSEVIYSMRKIRYLYQDVRRFAMPQGLVIKGPERIFDGTLAGIGMLYAQDQGVFEAYRDRVFERFFKRELDIDDPRSLCALFDEIQANGADFEAFAASEGVARHQRIQLQAEEEGVFGVPSMVFGGELFWGNDRIEWLRKHVRSQRLASS